MKSVKYKPSFKNIILNKCKNTKGIFLYSCKSDCQRDFETYYCYRCESLIYPDDYSNISYENDLYPLLYCENCDEIFFKGCEYSSIKLPYKKLCCGYKYKIFYYPKIIKNFNLLKFQNVNDISAYINLVAKNNIKQDVELNFQCICDNCLY